MSRFAFLWEMHKKRQRGGSFQTPLQLSAGYGEATDMVLNAGDTAHGISVKIVCPAYEDQPATLVLTRKAA